MMMGLQHRISICETCHTSLAGISYHVHHTGLVTSSITEGNLVHRQSRVIRRRGSVPPLIDSSIEYIYDWRRYLWIRDIHKWCATPCLHQISVLSSRLQCGSRSARGAKQRFSEGSSSTKNVNFMLEQILRHSIRKYQKKTPIINAPVSL